MPQIYEAGSEDDANPVMTDDLPEEKDAGRKSLVEKLKDKAKLPTLKDNVKKLKNKVPLRKNENNASENATDDDALFSQEDGHEEEDDRSSGEEYDSQKETPQEDASKQQQKTSTPVVAPQHYGESNVQTGNHPSEQQQQLHEVHEVHEVQDSLKNLSINPKDQSSSNQEKNHGNNLQEVEPKSRVATNNNSAGEFTGLKSIVIGSVTAAAGTMGSTFGYYSGDNHAREKPSSGVGDPGGNTYNNQQTTDHPATGLKDDAVDTKLGDTNNATTGEDDDETYIQKTQDTVVSSLRLDKPFDLNAPSFLDKTKEYMIPTTNVAKSYTAAATDMAYNTIDKVESAMAPGHDEQGLAQQVTETLSNLPTPLKESVFGPSSPTSNLATSAIFSPRDVKTGAPGLVSRVTGAVSSLFSSKKPEGTTTIDDSFPAPHENPTIQQEATGQGLKDKEENNLPDTSTPAFRPVNTSVPALDVFFLLKLLNCVNKLFKILLL